MKIVHLGKYFGSAFGGIEKALIDLAHSGRAMGAEVTCVVAKTLPSEKSFEELDGVRVRRNRTFGHLLSAPMCPQLLFQDLSSFDVVHLHVPNPWAELAVLKWLVFGKKKSQVLIPYLHSFPVNQKWLGRTWFSWITRRILKASRKIVVSSRKLIEDPTFSKWIEQEKIVEIPFAADSISQEQWKSVSEKRASSRLVLAIGRLVPYKGYDVLIRAWARASKETPRITRDFELAIAGEGGQRKRLEALIREHGLQESVKLVGQISDQTKADFLGGATLFVAPSVNSAETFGISILEAMSYGLPVITSRLKTGVATLAREGKCGAAVDPGSVEDLALALVRLLSEPELRKKAGKENLEFASREFSRQKLNENYRGLLGSPRSTTRKAA